MSIYMEAAKIQRDKIRSSKKKRAVLDKFNAMYEQSYLKAGVKLAKCGEWGHLWKQHYWLKPYSTDRNDFKKHNSTFDELQKELTANDINLQTETLKFMSTPDLEAVNLRNICKYFQHKEWYKNGKEFTAVIDKGPFHVMQYIEHAKYKPALKKVISYLGSNDIYARFAAVKALGEIGNKKVIRKLKIIAENDPYYVTDRYGNKDYQIRNRAKEAIQKIKLRE